MRIGYISENSLYLYHIWNNDSAKDAYQTVWADFYRYNPKEYLKTLIQFYDGHLKEWSGVNHLIVYRPSIIHVIKKLNVNLK